MAVLKWQLNITLHLTVLPASTIWLHWLVLCYVHNFDYTYVHVDYEVKHMDIDH